jgi:hypothetical protein
MKPSPAETQPIFPNLNFSFAGTPGIVFDPEVALELAEAVAQRDGGRSNHAGSLVRANVAIAGLSTPRRIDEDAPYTADIILPRDTLSSVYDPNAVFAREFQRALDAREHSRRTNIPLTIVGFAIISTLPGGGAAAVMSEKGLATDEALLAVGIGLGSAALALGGRHFMHNIYRQVATNEAYPNVHKIHLDRAARLAEKLELPPVLSRS